MKKSIRCCISCILPCGALDVIRIVHSNGRVEEISGSVKASDVMKAYPKHVLKKPSSTSADDDGLVPKIVVVPPDAELQRGKIYFLTPAEKTRTKTTSSTRKRNYKEQSERGLSNSSSSSNAAISVANLQILSSDRYLTDIMSEKLSTQRDRRRGRVAVWRPHLESISESPTHL
ncbi:phosphatidylinositol 4-phosphate 5-kinase MSS4-like protein [Senna tora]|uniref:Phosphatidylinositol 4-phosphate 5-kinase MSS4-like protein n=1 Tax=Senna tora TaxID=362788 RepID=A0A834SIU7_9FABA|nr:phosphatidylinositol 4-phosphate 5-kinase MSS4-like protein [Senna tora]